MYNYIVKETLLFSIVNTVHHNIKQCKFYCKQFTFIKSFYYILIRDFSDIEFKS